MSAVAQYQVIWRAPSEWVEPAVRVVGAVRVVEVQNLSLSLQQMIQNFQTNSKNPVLKIPMFHEMDPLSCPLDY